MKSPFSLLRHSLFLTAILLFTFSIARAQDDFASVKQWEGFDFAHSNVTPAQMNTLSLDELKLVRGIVFGKHGRIFKDVEIKRYLDSRD